MGRTISNEQQPCFGKSIKLGETDSFNEGEIDFYWKEICDPEKYDKNEPGYITCNCTTCGAFRFLDYPIARNGDYILLPQNEDIHCVGCNKPLKNHILVKRPDDWISPKERVNYSSLPKCPICSSTKMHKISKTNKVASILAFGIFSTGYVSKTYKCDICGAKF